MGEIVGRAVGWVGISVKIAVGMTESKIVGNTLGLLVPELVGFKLGTCVG